MSEFTTEIKTFNLDTVTTALKALGITHIRLNEIPAPETTDFLPRVRISLEAPDNMESQVAEILRAAT